MYDPDRHRRRRLSDLGWPTSQYNPAELVYETTLEDEPTRGLVLFHPEVPGFWIKSTCWHNLGEMV